MNNTIRLIGLGKCGASIIKQLTVYEGYSIVAVDNEEHDGVDTHLVPSVTAGKDEYIHELYDSLEHDWEGIEANCEEVQIVLSGASDISGIILQLLQHLDEKNVRTQIFYIYPDSKFLSSIHLMQNKVTFGVLQEYARSGLVDNIAIFDNAVVSQLVGKVSIANYYSAINQKIASVIHSFNYCNKNEPIFGSQGKFLEISRISCLGHGTIDGDINLFYDLKWLSEDKEIVYPLEIQYYFFASNERIENDQELMSKIMDKVKDEEKKYKTINYGIFEIDSEQEEISVLVYLCTSKIQSNQ